MRFPRFLIGLLAALFVFGVTTYLITGNSLAVHLARRLSVHSLIQLGYFVAILWLVSRRKSQVSDDAQKNPDDAHFQKQRRSIFASRLRRTR